MNKSIQIFSNEKFGEIRSMMIDDEPWFIGKDVAVILGYSNSRDALGTHVDDEDKNTVEIHDGNPGNPNMTIINESGLYSLIFSSKLESAKAFKRWVTSEVLPTIRKTGSYRTEQEEPIDYSRAKLAIAKAEEALRQAKNILLTMNESPVSNKALPSSPKEPSRKMFTPSESVWKKDVCGQEVRMIEIDGERWYALKDVLSLTGYGDSLVKNPSSYKNNYLKDGDCKTLLVDRDDGYYWRMKLIFVSCDGMRRIASNASRPSVGYLIDICLNL